MPIVGHWISIDDATGKEKSEISLYLENGKLYGKIERLLLPEDQGKICVECKGSEKINLSKVLLLFKDWKRKTKLDRWNHFRSCQWKTLQLYYFTQS